MTPQLYTPELRSKLDGVIQKPMTDSQWLELQRVNEDGKTQDATACERMLAAFMLRNGIKDKP
jgi:hypothetical protein